ncbi:hypothetical protein K2P47_03730 [Patescibacteria group bacterium]|nr:hypothetical protein [Patescibacteria group bacterium]
MNTNAPQLSGGQKAVFYGGATVMALLFVAPIVAIALGVVVNIAAIAAVGVVLLGVWMARPLAILKWKNFVLKALKAEARANPIETLQNEYLTRKALFEEANERLVTLVAMRDTIKEKIVSFEQKHRRSDADLQKMFEGLSKLIDQLQVSLKTARTKLDDFKKNLEYQSDRYKLAVHTGALANELRQATGDTDPMQQFLHDEAMDSIRSEFNMSMANINQLLLDDDTVPQIQAAPQLPMLDVTPIQLLEVDDEPVIASRQKN